MGAYLGVQQGSRFEPVFLHLSYRPGCKSGGAVAEGRRKCVVLVGKGLTFDSGGYNLKVGVSMIELMKIDMGGCAAVLGAARTVAQLKPDLEVHFVTALCENMVSAEAMRPGDVLVASNKKTIEVVNTDAEGRLTLADALVYASNIRSAGDLAPDAIVDLATLTGACVVALGEEMSALYTNDLSLGNKLLAAAEVRRDTPVCLCCGVSLTVLCFYLFVFLRRKRTTSYG
jgi:leucyl aminopeptidase